MGTGKLEDDDITRGNSGGGAADGERDGGGGFQTGSAVGGSIVYANSAYKTLPNLPKPFKHFHLAEKIFNLSR